MSAYIGLGMVCGPRDVSKYVLIRKAAGVCTTSWPAVGKDAALRRSPRRQAVAVKDRLNYLETARPGRWSRVVQTTRHGAVRIM